MSTDNFIEQTRDRAIEELVSFLRIPSVSTDPDHRTDIDDAAAWVSARLTAAGPFRVETKTTGGNPVVYGEWLGAPGQSTILVYGHYDVQPPDPLDSWNTPPFDPEIREGRVYARGASDDKGPMLVPIKAAEALFATEGRLPVNLKLVFEGEEEIGSPHLAGFVTEHAEMLAADYALSADGAMWRADLPSVITGSRGLAALNLELHGPAKDLHSGRHGGAVQNPLHALVELLSTLHAVDGSVQVNGFYDRVRRSSAAERAAIAALPFDDEAYRQEVGALALHGEPGYTTLERQWIRPTLELNGLGGGYQGTGGKTVVPSSTFAKISCRLVPDQEPEGILTLLRRHLEKYLPVGVALHIETQPGTSRPYRIPPQHPGLRIARRVLTEIYRQEPVNVLIGGTLPVSEIFARTLGIDTVYFSFSTADEDFHAPNEFFRLDNFQVGISAWIRFWHLASEGIATSAKDG